MYVHLGSGYGNGADVNIGGSSGSKYFSVYLTGLDDSSVGNAVTTSASAAAASSTPSHTTTAKPSVVTVGGKYLIFMVAEPWY